MLLGSLLSAGAAQGAPSISVVGLLGNGEYVPGTWVPLRLMLANDTDRAIDGQVEATVPGADGDYHVVTRVTMPANSRFRTAVYAPLAMLAKPGADGLASNVGIFKWTEAGANLAQTDLLLRPNGDDDAAVDRSVIVAFSGDGPEADAPSYDAYELRKPIGETLGLATAPLWSIAAAEAPVHPAGYDAARVVLFNGYGPNEFSVPQREALLTFVRSGGTLAVVGPAGAADVRGTWLEPLLPVQIVGTRLASKVGTTGGPVALREPVQIAEAVATGDADVTTVWRDAHYVHAAHRPLGLGRIVFTSFPVNAPRFDATAEGEAMRLFWADLLGLAHPDPSWAGTQLPGQRKNVLREMIGTPAPARGLALGMAGGFVLLVLAMQLVWRGPARPIAFAASALAAVVVAGALAGVGWFAQRADPLTAGRVSVLTLGRGGGIVQEVAAFTGNVPNVSLSAGLPGAVMQAVAYDASAPPTLAADTFASPSAGIAAGRIDRLWQARASAPSDLRASATGTFDETGLRLSIDNGLPTPLAAPVLVRGTSVYRLPALPSGATQLPLDPAARNAAQPVATDLSSAAADDNTAAVTAAQKYLNTGPILTEVDKLRALVLSSVLTRSRSNMAAAPNASPPTVIAGWLDSTGASPLIQASAEPQVQQALRLAMFPLQIRPSPVGAPVRVDAGFNAPVLGKVAIPVFDANTGAWLSSSQPGQWQIGFRPPREVGRLTLTRATVRLNVSLPVQSLILRRGQVRDGQVDENLAGAGDEVVRFAPTFGAQSPITLDLTPADFDADGTLWFGLAVEAPLDSGGMMPLWNITDFGVDLEGRVVGDAGATRIEDGG